MHMYKCAWLQRRMRQSTQARLCHYCSGQRTEGGTEWQKCKGQYTRPHRSRGLYSGTYKVNTQNSYAYTHEEIYRSKPTETLLKHTLTPTVYLVASQFKWKSLIQNMTLLVYVSETRNALLQVWFNPEFPEGTRLSNLDFLLFSRYYYLRVTSY